MHRHRRGRDREKPWIALPHRGKAAPTDTAQHVTDRRRGEPGQKRFQREPPNATDKDRGGCHLARPRCT